ncbi:UNVERIFIED_CONTAM: hypothetical protein K2H54_030394 [Gekko kuhli]
MAAGVDSLSRCLERYLPAEQLGEVKRILYGEHVRPLDLPSVATSAAAERNFELLGYGFQAELEQLRQPRVVRVGLIQNKIQLPTDALVAEQDWGVVNSMHQKCHIVCFLRDILNCKQ